MRYTLLLLAALALSACAKRAEPPAPQQSARDSAAVSRDSGSIYSADLSFVDQWGHKVHWSDLKGKVRVMAMIFTHCEYACPRITKDMQNVEKLLPKNDPRIGYTLVSFDTERDSVGQLQKYYRTMSLDSNWVLLHGNDADTRTVSALLDVKYQRMADGAFSHQSVILVIDRNGHIALRHEGLEGDPKEIAAKVQSLL